MSYCSSSAPLSSIISKRNFLSLSSPTSHLHLLSISNLQSVTSSRDNSSLNISNAFVPSLLNHRGSFISPFSKLKKSNKAAKVERVFDLEMGFMGRRMPLVISIMVATFCTSSYVTATAASTPTQFVKKAVSSHDIVIFSKSYCPYCQRAKAVFKELKQTPHIVELDQRDDGSQIQSALSEIVGRRTVPQVFVNGKHVGGSDDTIEAYENGELAKLLGSKKDDL
ncbi:hypothetical protein GIB67_013087 [Kingdonia uniflora]|uniref:Glutaredoxin domain-containing protein n=1 Tax=Kingdonia uniflora TaxID=39325 RepID=A0A7J7LX79_9MAGN|nr:hypothetical protein GIB67_013087 [Kingdonia uniflora]